MMLAKGRCVSWLTFWIIAHVALQVLGLWHIARNRHSMQARTVVKWVLLLILVPVIGVIGYMFFLLDKAVQRGTPGRRDEAASFLSDPRFKDS